MRDRPIAAEGKLYADLHTHTTASDGLLTPSALVALASKIGLGAIGITDHDSTDGIKEACIASKRWDIEVIPGIELNTQFHRKEIHILGYYINTELAWFQEILLTIRQSRQFRAKKIVENLRRLYNMDISFNEAEKESGKKVVSRPHIARVLVQKGIVQNTAEAFEKYLGNHCPAYESKYRLTPEEGIKLIKKAGGVPVLAHPGLLIDDSLIEMAINQGVEGIEAYHSKHTDKQCKCYASLARYNELIITGGSDYHGEQGEGAPKLGDIKIPYELVQDLKIAAG